MKKTLSNLGKELSKQDQQSINGGIFSFGCSNVCKTAKRGTRCFQDGYLAACDGRGGFVYY
ncbi:hypothetical protein [Tenacibaculum jejuense]|uniref:hypothetical protein n=1 Tax=Tenacibaculum jejuense TaxID=584609 RepID=UPI000BA398DF|nr:hypothetical protein [Tenacibaculum jejuense]